MQKQTSNKVSYFFWKNIEKSLFLIILVLFANILSPILTFAQTTPTKKEDPKICIACSITPKWVSDFIKFSYEVLWIIAKPKVEPDKQLQWPEWLFSQWVLNTIDSPRNPNKTEKDMFNSIKKWMKNNASTLFQSFETTALVMWRLLNPKDLVVWIRTVLRYPDPIVRDYKKVLDLDDALSDRLYQLWTEWQFSKIVNIDQIWAIKQASKKYQWSWQTLFAQDWFIIKPSVTYWQIVQFLRVLNTKYKTFITINKSSQFWDMDDLKKAWKENISIVFSPTLRTDLENDYSCARSIFSKCKNNWKLFIENIKNILKSTKKDWLTSIMTFKTSMVRLQKAMQWTTMRKKKKSTQCSNKTKRYELNWTNTKNKWRVYIDPDTKQEYLYVNNNWERTQVLLQEDKDSWKTIWTESPVKESVVLTNCQFKTREMWSNPKSKADIKDFLNRENELLRTQYWVYIKNAKYDKSLIWRWLSLLKPNREKQIKNNIKNKVQTFESNVSDKIANSVDKFKSFFNLWDREQKKILKELMWTDYNIDASKFKSIWNLYNDLYSSIQQTTAEHIINYNQITLNDTTDITKAIGQMVQKIRFSTHNIKDKDKPNSLINNLWEACEWQCVNQGWKCWSE